MFTASQDGLVRAYPAAECGDPTRTSLWFADIRSTITGGPVLPFGHLYIGTSDGRLIAYTR